MKSTRLDVPISPGFQEGKQSAIRILKSAMGRPYLSKRHDMVPILVAETNREDNTERLIS